MRAYQSLEVAVAGPAATITLNRPDKLNAMSFEMVAEILDAVGRLDKRGDVRVIQVTGRGRAFCAGVDVGGVAAELFASGPPAEKQLRALAARGQAMVDAVLTTRAVTVASVRGYAIGGGLLLMAACDLRVAAADAVLAVPELDIGIPYTWSGVPLLVRELGLPLARDLVMTGRRVTPEQIASSGFVQRVVPPAELETQSAELVQTLVGKPALPLAVTKQQLLELAGGVEPRDYAAGDEDRFAQALTDEGFLPAAMKYMQGLKKTD